MTGAVSEVMNDHEPIEPDPDPELEAPAETTFGMGIQEAILLTEPAEPGGEPEDEEDEEDWEEGSGRPNVDPAGILHANETDSPKERAYADEDDAEGPER